MVNYRELKMGKTTKNKIREIRINNKGHPHT